MAWSDSTPMTSKRKAWTGRAPWLVLAITLAGAAGLLLPMRGTAQPALAGTVFSSEPAAPSFNLRDQWGRSVSLAQLHGRAVVLTFLESHCQGQCPIVAETLRQTLDGLGRDQNRVAIIAVSTDPRGDTLASVRQFSRQHGMLYRWHYLVGSRADLSRVWQAYYVYAPPANAPPALRDGHTSATYLIDRNGRERVLMGGEPEADLLDRDIRILAGLPIPQPDARSPAPESGHPAPDIITHRLAGASISLRSFRGKVVLLNFWATWCQACRSEMPRLTRWYERLKTRGFVVVGIDQEEDAGAVAAFARKLHVTYPLALDANGSLSARYHVVGLPTSFIIDRNGVVRSVQPGLVDDAYLRAHVDSLIYVRAPG